MPAAFAKTFSAAFLKELEQAAIRRTFDAGEVIIDATRFIRSVPLILKGAVEVMRVDEDAEGELLLYYLEPGQTCAASLSCCLGMNTSPIRATALLDTQLWMVPLQHLEPWMARFPTWRTFVLRSYGERFDELLGAIDDLAFGDLSQRLAANLEEKLKLHGAHLSITHRQLAVELHTSRVVITRLLRALERNGAIEQSRAALHIVNPKALYQ